MIDRDGIRQRLRPLLSLPWAPFGQQVIDGTQRIIVQTKDPKVANFIAHAPDDMVELLSELETLRARATAAEHQLASMQRDRAIIDNALMHMQQIADRGSKQRKWFGWRIHLLYQELESAAEMAALAPREETYCRSCGGTGAAAEGAEE